MSTTTSTNATMTTSYREYALKQISAPKPRTGRRLLRALLAFLFTITAMSGIACADVG
jgi:hypothetical protein